MYKLTCDFVWLMTVVTDYVQIANFKCEFCVVFLFLGLPCLTATSDQPTEEDVSLCT